jgi:hypothetical protein
MKLLLIEDESDFIEDLTAAAGENDTVLAPQAAGLLVRELPDTAPVEDSLAALLTTIIREHGIDLVLLDSDLSHAKGDLQAQSGYRAALQKLGMPVCRYQKGGSETQFTWWRRLNRAMIEGADAIWIARAMVSGDRLPELMPWLQAVHSGFTTITERLRDNPTWLQSQGVLGPADVLAMVLGEPKAKVDFLGYTAQSLLFFAGVDEPSDLRSEQERYATRLGYWLFNYILTFPGPILPSGAAAALLNLEQASFESEPVQALVEPCVYTGPFGGTERYYWRSDLVELVEAADGNIALTPALAGAPLVRLDARNPGAEAYWCVLSQAPVLAADTAPTPEWIPSGATQSRVSQAKLDQLGPLLGI